METRKQRVDGPYQALGFQTWVPARLQSSPHDHRCGRQQDARAQSRLPLRRLDCDHRFLPLLRPCLSPFQARQTLPPLLDRCRSPACRLDLAATPDSTTKRFLNTPAVAFQLTLHPRSFPVSAIAPSCLLSAFSCLQTYRSDQAATLTVTKFLIRPFLSH